MQHRKFAFVYPALALAVTLGCGKAPGTVEKKSESTTETAQGKVETTRESTQAGGNLEAKAETKVETADGTMKAKTETYVGTVTTFAPGKKIEILTTEKKTRSFDLDDKDLMANVDSGVAVGSRVKLVEEKGENKTHRITVTRES